MLQTSLYSTYRGSKHIFGILTCMSDTMQRPPLISLTCQNKGHPNRTYISTHLCKLWLKNFQKRLYTENVHMDKLVFLNHNGILILVSHLKKVMCNGQTKMATSGLFRLLSDIFDELTSLKLEDFFGSSYGCYYIRIGNRHWCIRIEQRYEISSLCKIAIYDMSQVKSETPRSSSYLLVIVERAL